MHPEAREELRARFKFVVLNYAEHVGATKACRMAPKNQRRTKLPGSERVFWGEEDARR